MKDEKDLELEKKKKKKGVIIGFILLILIILGLVGYILYDKGVVKLDTKKEKTETKEEVPKELSVDDKIVADAMEIMDRIYISEDNLYKNDSYNISEISNDDLIATAIKNIDGDYIVSACEFEKERKTISFESLNTALNKVVLNKKITNDMITGLGKSPYTIAQYGVNDIGIILSNNGLKLVGSCGGTFGGVPYINKKVIKAEKNNKYLYVYEKQAFASYNYLENDSHAVDYYKDYDKTNVIEKGLDSIEFTDADGNHGKNSTPNWDLYNTYKYTFEKHDDNYYFVSFELVK